MAFIFGWPKLIQQAFQSDDLANTGKKQLIIQKDTKCKKHH